LVDRLKNHTKLPSISPPPPFDVKLLIRIIEQEKWPIFVEEMEAFLDNKAAVAVVTGEDGSERHHLKVQQQPSERMNNNNTNNSSSETPYATDEDETTTNAAYCCGEEEEDSWSLWDGLWNCLCLSLYIPILMLFGGFLILRTLIVSYLLNTQLMADHGSNGIITTSHHHHSSHSSGSKFFHSKTTWPPPALVGLALLTVIALIVHPDGYTWILLRRARYVGIFRSFCCCLILIFLLVCVKMLLRCRFEVPLKYYGHFLVVVLCICVRSLIDESEVLKQATCLRCQRWLGCFFGFRSRLSSYNWLRNVPRFIIRAES
jgi:hypothetical protein